MRKYLRHKHERKTVERIIRLLGEIGDEWEGQKVGVSLSEIHSSAISDINQNSELPHLKLPRSQKFLTSELFYNKNLLHQITYALLHNVALYRKMGTPLIVKEMSNGDFFGIKYSNIGPKLRRTTTTLAYCRCCKGDNVFARRYRGPLAAKLTPNRPGLGLTFVRYFADIMGYEISYDIAPLKISGDDSSEWRWHHLTLSFPYDHVLVKHLR